MGKHGSKIRSNVPVINGDNMYNWSIPSVSGTFDSKLRVVSTTNSTVLGMSRTFTLTNVASSFTVTNPKKGDSKQAGVADIVKFSYQGPKTLANVYFTVDSGNTWKLLADNISIIKGDTTIAIKIPIETLASNGGLIKVFDTTGLTGISELFTIKAAPATINVTSPVAKAYLLSGNTQAISWEGYSVDTVKIEYSLDNGTTWLPIQSKVVSTNGINSFNWNVVSVTEAKKASLIRISSLADNTSGKSAIFTISNTYPSTDARLTEIAVNGKIIATFDAETLSYDFKVPYSIIYAPKVSVKTSGSAAKYSIKNVAKFNGSTAITVTAEDGITMRTYFVNFYKDKASSNASLADLKVNGKTISSFKPTTHIYNVILPAGTTVVPAIVGAVADTTAKIVVNNATLNGKTTIVVTAEDGVTKATYEIDFSVAVDVELVAANPISIYPNPVIDNLIIANAENSKIFIYNLNGQTIKAINNIDKFVSINFSSFEPGAYILRIVKGDAVTERKVIKLK